MEKVLQVFSFLLHHPKFLERCVRVKKGCGSGGWGGSIHLTMQVTT